MGLWLFCGCSVVVRGFEIVSIVVRRTGLNNWKKRIVNSRSVDRPFPKAYLYVPGLLSSILRRLLHLLHPLPPRRRRLRRWRVVLSEWRVLIHFRPPLMLSGP